MSSGFSHILEKWLLIITCIIICKWFKCNSHSCSVTFLDIFIYYRHLKSDNINILPYFLEAIDEMRHILFVEMDDGYEPCGNLYADISKGIFKFAGILLASLICMGGPASNFFSPWIFEFMLHGGASVLQSLPNVMVGDSVTKKTL